jgi:uncharacterized membrane protein YdbT with pleckstrin-like domain
MICPHCSHANADEAVFCNKCGERVTSPVPAAQLTTPRRTVPNTEGEIWTGTMSRKGALNWWWIISFLLVVPILIYMVVIWLKRFTTYRLTTERMTITRGVFSRQSEDIQLVRIEDVEYSQSFIQRLLNVGTIRVLSTDKTKPELDMHGIDNPAQFKEKLWALVRERRQNMVMMEQLNV